MTIWIDNRGDSPIYEQIVLQLREQILSGSLPPGTALPSIRALAKDLRISVITTKRAYEELEAGGWVRTVPGKGSFVAEGDHGPRRETLLRELRAHLGEAKKLAAACGLTQRELQDLLTREDGT